MLVSLIVPVYRGASMLDDTFSRLIAMEKELPGGAKIEIVAVDDGSDDDSFAKIVENQKRFPDKIRAVRLVKNYGSMPAVRAGIEHAHGDCVAQLPQDLQDPPESIPEMFAAWQNGDKINLTYRTARAEPPLKKMLAAAYHFLFRALTGINYPPGGLGVFLIDRQIADEIKNAHQNRKDILLRIFAMGGVRLHAAPRLPPKTKTNWTFAKNIKLVIDNFVGFSYLPVRLMSLAGILTALGSFVFAAYVLVGKLTGWYPISQPPGWATIVVLLTFLSGMIMLMLGVIGEYLWRILDAVRGEPLYRVAEVREFPAQISCSQKTP